MNILYISDNNYADILAVSMVSLFENNRSGALDVYLIGSGISAENKRRLHMLFDKFGRGRLHYIEMPDIESKVSASINTKNYNLAKYSMCFINAILPDEIEKILYLDCDTVIRHSLEELWNTDVSDVIFAAVDDVKSSWHKKSIGLDGSLPYINAGVILVNLNNWKKYRVDERSVQMLDRFGGKIPHREQGILNYVAGEHKRLLHPKYNLQTAQLIYTYGQMLSYRKPQDCFPEEVHAEAVADPVIVHYTKNLFIQSRPWMTDCTHPFAKEYRKYEALTSWGISGLKKCGETKIQTAARLFYRVFPKGFVAWMGGFLQAYMAPMKDCLINGYKLKGISDGNS